MSHSWISKCIRFINVWCNWFVQFSLNHLCRNDAEHRSVLPERQHRDEVKIHPFHAVRRGRQPGIDKGMESVLWQNNQLSKKLLKERERWDRLFFCRKPIPTISFERGMVKKAGTGECDGNKKKEKEKWRGKRGERKRSATLTRVLKSSSYGQPAPSLLRPLDQLATSCVPPLTLFTFLGVRELIRVPYFSRLQRLPNINRRKRQGKERDRKRTSFFPS